MRTRDVACIVLAAGESTRFGSRKQLENLAGESLAHRAVRAAVESSAGIIVVVVGADAASVQASISEFTSIAIVVNDKWKSGLSSSILAGLHALENPEALDGILITLADQPLVNSECLDRLLGEFDEHNRIVASAYDGAVGVPAIIGAEYVPDLLNLHGDRGAGKWLKARLGSVTVVPMPEAAIDIDTPQDLAQVKSALEHDA